MLLQFQFMGCHPCLKTTSRYIKHGTNREMEWKARQFTTWNWFQERQFTTSMATRSLPPLPLSLAMWLSTQGPCQWSLGYSMENLPNQSKSLHSTDVPICSKSSIKRFNVDLVGWQDVQWKYSSGVPWCRGSKLDPFSHRQAELSDAKLLEWKHWSTDDFLSENGALHGACSFLIHLQWQCPGLLFWSEACSQCIRCCVMLCFMFLRWPLWFKQFSHRHLIAREFWGRSSESFGKRTMTRFAEPIPFLKLLW